VLVSALFWRDSLSRQASEHVFRRLVPITERPHTSQRRSATRRKDASARPISVGFNG
jgi:hypothetical protein